MVFFSSRRQHTRYWRDWCSDVCSSDLDVKGAVEPAAAWDGVYVAAEEDSLLRVAGGRGPEVSGLVAFDLHAIYLFELAFEPEIGRASCRERVQISVVAVSLKINELCT